MEQFCKTNKNFLEIKNLTFKPNSKVTILKNISFTVKKGEILSIVGPNGAGKTTLLEVLSGSIKANSGNIVFKGEEILNMPIESILRKKIARTFQSIRLYNDLTVLENLKISQAFSKISEKLLNDFIEIGNLKDYLHRKVSQLSYGIQRVVEIIRTLILQPEVMLLDEPAAGMNNSETKGLAKLLLRLKLEQLSIILIEHNVNFVEKVSDRVIVLNDGEIVLEGMPKKIFSSKIVKEIYFGN